MSPEPRSAPAEPMDLLLLLWSKRRLIIALTALGALAGVVAAFVITPRFKSEVVMFPALSNAFSKSLLNEGQQGLDLMEIGEEEQAQTLLQVLHSDRIRDRVAERFGLMGVYGIDPNGAHRKAELYEAYKDHVRITYTKYGSVSVEVMDVEPQRAADMANAIADLADTVWTEMARERAMKGYALVERRVNEQEAYVRRMSDSLRVLRGLGLQDLRSQSERFTQALGEALVKGNDRAVNAIEQRFEPVARYGGPYQVMDEGLGNEIWRLGVYRMRLSQARSDLENDIPHKFLLERAQPSDKKAYPVRWLITVISAVSGLLFALLVLVVQHQAGRLRHHG